MTLMFAGVLNRASLFKAPGGAWDVRQLPPPAALAAAPAGPAASPRP